MYPHRIRLRGPWECKPTHRPPRRVTVPFQRPDWLPANEPVVLTRKFGYPGRIDAHERVWLTLANADGPATLTLNGHSLGRAGDGPFEADVTAFLQQHNHLDISTRGNQLGDVALEVRASAFLQNVCVRDADGKLQVTGTVAGTCERPLELYVLVDSRHALYRTINAGESFAADLAEHGARVRVELINVATVWYVVEVEADQSRCD